MPYEFSGEVWFWRGPAPWYFVSVPEDVSVELRAASGFVSYGWGMIPVMVEIGRNEWATSLWPKDDIYVVPLKSAIRTAEGIEDGDVVDVRLTVRAR
jgi:hypothetical protein